MGTVYLIHFHEKLKHAQHYIGWSDDGNLEKRLEHHRRGTGSALMKAIKKAKIKWSVARTWGRVDRHFERRLKNCKAAHRFCPICRGDNPTQDLKMENFTPTQEVPF